MRSLSRTWPRRNFGTVLAVIVTAVVFQLAAPTTDATRLIGVIIQGSVVVIALRAAGGRRHVLVLTATVAIALAVIAAIALVGTEDLGPGAARLITLVLILLTPTAVVAGVAATSPPRRSSGGRWP
ncbi:MAG: hypothetical protein ABIZ50_08215 [Solirubrobacterales bacterium]